MRQLPWIIVLVAAATSFGLWLGLRPSAPEAPTSAAFSQYPQPRSLSPFALDGSDGHPVDAGRLAGKLHLVFFGFTHCPDVCPTALAVMREIDQGLAAARLE